jgi:hypothetical protein
VLQMTSVVGALAILGAYAASQFGLAGTSKLACGCGEEAILLGLLGDAQCPCGADLAAFVRGKRRAGTGEKRDTNRPWRSSYRVRSSTSRNSEYNTWQELRTLE